MDQRFDKDSNSGAVVTNERRIRTLIKFDYIIILIIFCCKRVLLVKKTELKCKDINKQLKITLHVR